MGIGANIANASRVLFGGKPKQDESLSLRRFESSNTDRTNSKHWANATGNAINDDLSLSLDTMRARSAFEAANNGYVAGMIETHVTAVVGKIGPSLQVLTKNQTYADRLEKRWSEWWASPDINGQLSGPDMLDLWLRSLWLNGEYLFQLTKDESGDNRPAINNIHPDRLVEVGDIDASMGIKRSPTGKPLEYYIDDRREGDGSQIGVAPTPYSPEEIFHRFKITEPGQARGIPWLQSVLQVAADIRDLEVQILDAARQAADWGVYLYTEEGDAASIAPGTSIDVQRRVMRTVPPGWKPAQMQGHQPSMNHLDYLLFRLSELGRPVNMPGLMVLLNSANHNYSSARFDGQLFWRGVATLQNWFARSTLNPLVSIHRDELGATGNKPPADLRFKWVWPTEIVVDPAKEETGIQTELENGALSFAELCARKGLDWRDVLSQQDTERKAFAATDVPYPPNQATQKNIGEDGNEPEKGKTDAAA